MFHHYCLLVNVMHVTCGSSLSVPLVCLTIVAWLITQTNVLYLDQPAKNLTAVYVTAKSIL